jgi:hypothetical protein
MLKKNKLIESLNICEFRKESLIYLGHMIGGEEMRVDLDKVVAINQWPIPTNLIEAISFMGEAQYLGNFIANFSVVVTPLHATTSKINRFHWVKPQK